MRPHGCNCSRTAENFDASAGIRPSTNSNWRVAISFSLLGAAFDFHFAPCLRGQETAPQSKFLSRRASDRHQRVAAYQRRRHVNVFTGKAESAKTYALPWLRPLRRAPRPFDSIPWSSAIPILSHGTWEHSAVDHSHHGTPNCATWQSAGRDLLVERPPTLERPTLQNWLPRRESCHTRVRTFAHLWRTHARQNTGEVCLADDPPFTPRSGRSPGRRSPRPTAATLSPGNISSRLDLRVPE